MSTSQFRDPSYHHGDLRAGLIAAALAIIEDGGAPAALSLREVARRAGVSAMAPYRHFTDKAALLAATAQVGFQRLEAVLREADKAVDPATALDEQGVAYVAFACENPTLFRLMFGSMFAKKHGDLAAAGDAAFAVMAARVARLTGGDPQGLFALRCWATAHGLASLAVDGQLSSFGRSPVELARELLHAGSRVSSRTAPSV